MLRQLIRSTINISSTNRCLCSQSGSNLKDKDIIGEELAEALNNVTDDLHKNNLIEKKKTRLSILSKLTESAKESFNTATGHETVEVLHDREIANLLNSLDVKPEKINKFVETRKDTKVITSLRREIFYQAHQSGIPANEAHVLAEKAVSLAEQKLKARREAKIMGIEEKEAAKRKEEEEINEKEKKFYDLAYQWMEKNLYVEQEPGSFSSSLPKEVPVDKSIPNIFDQTSLRLNIFEKPEEFKTVSLKFWDDWNSMKAEIISKNMGPTNKIEQQIEWTKEGKLWPYPINNEYQLGEELKVGFYDHIFVERYLKKYNLPKTGPIAHFMELVCVGLSKNCYMTAAKKREHLDWFGKFFDAKRQESVAVLHEKEQIAASNAV
uniref:Small ribosomal subunit protein mS31 n=1 Tax=Parastrongyloides trichosuri TaxID=131310 RepID=A0A0N4ZV84_PARTI